MCGHLRVREGSSCRGEEKEQEEKEQEKDEKEQEG